jgi:hypothetical protein
MNRRIMKVCRGCPDQNLPECCKGGCAKRDAWLEQERNAKIALQKDKDEESAHFAVLRHGKSWRRM